MKKCIRCGAELADEAGFCSACGASQTVEVAADVQTGDTQTVAVDVPVDVPADVPVDVSVGVAPTGASANPVIAMVRWVGSSAPMLTAVIAFGCMILFAFMQLLIMDSVIGAAIECVIPAFLFAGVLRFYLACRKPAPTLSANGLKMTRVAYTVRYVLYIISLSLLTLVTLLIFVGLMVVPMHVFEEGVAELFEAFGSAGVSLDASAQVILFELLDLGIDTLRVLAGVLFAGVVIALVLYCLYGAKLIRSLRTVQTAAETGALPRRASGLVIVFNYLLAAVGCVSVLFGVALFTRGSWSLALVGLPDLEMIVSTDSMALLAHLLGVLSVAGMVVAVIAGTVCLQRYNAQVKSFERQVQN